MLSIEESHTVVFPFENQYERLLYWFKCNEPVSVRANVSITTGDLLKSLCHIAVKCDLLVHEFPSSSPGAISNNGKRFFLCDKSRMIVGMVFCEDMTHPGLRMRDEDPLYRCFFMYVPSKQSVLASLLAQRGAVIGSK